MDGEFFKWFATLGVGGALAGMMFLVYRKDVRQFTDLWRAQSELMVTVVQENTTSITKVGELLSGLQQQMRENDLDARIADRDARKQRKR